MKVIPRLLRPIYKSSIERLPFLNFSKTNNALTSDLLVSTQKQNAKNLHRLFVKLTSSNVKKIMKLPQEEAAKYCFKLVCKSIGVPKEIRPRFQIRSINAENPKICGTYSWIDNTLCYYKDARINKKLGKCWMFGLLRHEMEHYRQTIDTFRSAELSAKYLSWIENLARKANVEESEIQKYKQWYTNLETKVAKHYPKITAESKEYSKTKKYTENMINYKTSRKNRKEFFAYLVQPLEFDACKTQGFNWLNYIYKKTFHN